jgi:D-beta-D-heptose 7-phosphate kinase/D-beta-D-heptose 1-phosphate adenosyltransferase
LRGDEVNRLVVVGDALLDRDLLGSVSRMAPDAPVPVMDVSSGISRPGGAGLAALLAARDGRPVTPVTALGTDNAGRELADLLAGAAVDVIDLGLDGATPEKVRARAASQPLLRLDYGGGPAQVGPLPDAGRRALAGAGAVLVADYGRGMTSEPGVRDALAGLPARRPVVWDPHPRGADPVPGARVVTPNRAEAGLPEDAGLAAVTRRARRLATEWSATGVAVTLGSRGAVFVQGAGPPLAVPAPPAGRGDPCGAGDRFAATTAALLADGALPSEAVTAAVKSASAFVAAGAAGALRTSELRPSAADAPSVTDDPYLLAERVRAAGGTVVATGGCFDLVHAGHVSVLEAARALGDCLIVCLNSDASVRRLKGPGRPLQHEADRARVLGALGCVDGLIVFDEDTPEAVLDKLRPDVFAKGGDYATGDLPEAALLSTWGGQAVVLPYLEGRSTTRLLQEATARARF